VHWKRPAVSHVTEMKLKGTTKETVGGNQHQSVGSAEVRTDKIVFPPRRKGRNSGHQGGTPGRKNERNGAPKHPTIGEKSVSRIGELDLREREDGKRQMRNIKRQEKNMGNTQEVQVN